MNSIERFKFLLLRIVLILDTKKELMHGWLVEVDFMYNDFFIEKLLYPNIKVSAHDQLCVNRRCPSRDQQPFDFSCFSFA